CLLLVAGLLINVRRLESHLATGGSQHKIAIGRALDGICAFKLQLDFSRIGTGGNGEVVLQTSLAPVKVQIDSRIKVVIANPAKLRNVAQPARRIIADKVVRVPWKPFGSVYRSDVRTGELHSDITKLSRLL